MLREFPMLLATGNVVARYRRRHCRRHLKGGKEGNENNQGFVHDYWLAMSSVSTVMTVYDITKAPIAAAGKGGKE